MNFIIKKKQNGFILLLTMLIISAMSLIVMSVSLKVFVSRNLISILNQNHERNILLSNSISIIQSIISNPKNKNNKSNENELEKNLNNNKNEKETSENKKDKSKELYKNIFNMIWSDFYKWQKINLSNENDGINAEISYYLMCEDGKIGINNFIKKINKFNKKNKDNDENKDNLNSNNQQNKNNESSESKENNDKKDNEKNENSKKNYLKIVNEFFKKIKEKSSAIKYTYSELIEKGNENSDQKTISSSSEKEFITEIYKKYESYKNELLPESLWSLFGNLVGDKELYSLKNKTSEKENDKNSINFKTGDIFSTYNKKTSIFYLCPALIESLNKGEKFELTEENKKKIIENGSKIISSENNSNIKEIWGKIYPIPFPDEAFKELKPEDFFSIDKTPNNISAIIEISQNDFTITALVVFEKNAFFGKNSNINYFVKQIYYLKKE